MFLSHLLINIGDNPDRPRPGRLWLRNLYHVHQRLCMGFPSDSRKRHDPDFLAPYTPDGFPEQRHLSDKKKTEVDQAILKQVHSQRGNDSGFLFRIDPHFNGHAVILVQSAIEPDWRYAFHNACYLLAAPPEVKFYNPCFTKGQRLRFRLVVNPTRRLSKNSPDVKKESIGKRVPVSTDKFHEWLVRRAEGAGFLIDEKSITVQPGYIYINKSRDAKGQRLRSVSYEGISEVADPIIFKETLVHGIGPGKAFGFGLLSVMPCQASPQAVAE